MSETSNCKLQVLSDEYRDFIISQTNEIPVDNVCIQNTDFIYSVIHVEKERADPVEFGRYSYQEIPKCYTLIDMEAMSQAGILQVQNYPTLGLQGSNVLIGFVDTGIDYQNPIFRNLDGSSRIVGLWDQTIQEGVPPEGFFYGSEYRTEQLNIALQSQNPLEIVPSRDIEGHGTFLASIAAGSVNEENQFIGAAPDSAIAVVKLKEAKPYLKEFYQIYTGSVCYQETDILLGISYLNHLARELNLPMVLCIAIGTNMGGHSALSPLSGLLEFIGSEASRAVVIGAGNEANQRHHYLGKLEGKNDIKEVEIRVSDGVQGFIMELWTESPNIVKVTVVSPSGERFSTISVRNNETQEYRFLFEQTIVRLNYELFLAGGNAELIYFQWHAPTQGIWKVIVEPLQIAEGVFHIWLPITEFLEQEVYFLESNPDNTITEPSSTITGMTVGFYNGNDNSIAISSGRGYTRNGIIKPNFVAPGVNVTGATVRETFEERTGSSIAAGITAGAAALMLEWVVYQLGDSTADSVRIRNLLTLGTERIDNEVYPNRTWGYGRLNLYRAFQELRNL